MKLTGFQVTMYKCVLDSKWVEVPPLTVLVGKNESGKTSLLKALHKFNPYEPESYNIDREWPRSRRDERSDEAIVCLAEFELTDDERKALEEITTEPVNLKKNRLRVSRDYAGRFEVLFPEGVFPEKLHPNDIDRILAALPELPTPVGNDFTSAAEKAVAEATRLAHEGRFSELTDYHQACAETLNSEKSEQQSHPKERTNEDQHTRTLVTGLKEVATKLSEGLTMHQKAHEFIVKSLPTFVYMDEYRTFTGTAMLDEVLARQNKRPTRDDETLLTILAESSLDLETLVAQGTEEDREQRQYDLDDGAATLTGKIERSWRQLKYEIKFRADGLQFLTFVKGLKDRALIRLEERSRGFQWFFSFDLLLMHQTKGTLKGCVILLDEPGLHLHPEGQRDLLARLEAYAEGNVLLYTSHLPFMINLEEPDRIRILSETEKDGTVITTDFTQTQPEGKLTLQAALGISGRTSYLVAEQNLVVEGADDYWYITAISNVLRRSGLEGLPDFLRITPAGGAQEVTYIATFMTGQDLDVVALYDTDPEGKAAMEKFTHRWLTRYKDKHATALSLGHAVETTSKEFSIEDLFPDDFYLGFVEKMYDRQLAGAGVSKITLSPGSQLCKRIESFFEGIGHKVQQGIDREKDLWRTQQDGFRRQAPSSNQAHEH